MIRKINENLRRLCLLIKLIKLLMVKLNLKFEKENVWR